MVVVEKDINVLASNETIFNVTDDTLGFHFADVTADDALDDHVVAAEVDVDVVGGGGGVVVCSFHFTILLLPKLSPFFGIQTTKSAKVGLIFVVFFAKRMKNNILFLYCLVEQSPCSRLNDLQVGQSMLCCCKVKSRQLESLHFPRKENFTEKIFHC